MDIQVSPLGYELCTNMSLEYRVRYIPIQYTDVGGFHGGHFQEVSNGRLYGPPH